MRGLAGGLVMMLGVWTIVAADFGIGSQTSRWGGFFMFILGGLMFLHWLVGPVRR